MVSHSIEDRIQRAIGETIEPVPMMPFGRSIWQQATYRGEMPASYAQRLKRDPARYR